MTQHDTATDGRVTWREPVGNSGYKECAALRMTRNLIGDEFRLGDAVRRVGDPFRNRYRVVQLVGVVEYTRAHRLYGGSTRVVLVTEGGGRESRCNPDDLRPADTDWGYADTTVHSARTRSRAAARRWRAGAADRALAREARLRAEGEALVPMWTRIAIRDYLDSGRFNESRFRALAHRHAMDADALVADLRAACGEEGA